MDDLFAQTRFSKTVNESRDESKIHRLKNLVQTISGLDSDLYFEALLGLLLP